MNDHKLRAPANTYNNQDLLIWALYLAGGAENWIDIEELYLKAFELAPARLSWRTRQDIPNYQTCHKALFDLQDSGNPWHLPVVIRNGRYERRLTADGLRWCKENEEHLQALYSSSQVVPGAFQDDARRVRAIINSPAYGAWAKAGELTCERWELAEALRCRANSPISTWLTRLDEHLISAQRNGHEDVEGFLNAARKYIDDEVTSQ